ncbi:MAG: cation:proton antiporter family protein, partial [Nanoarchaeota archaeon]
KQPPIIAYLVSGVLVGPLALNIIGDADFALIKLFAHLGVALLLFIVGLNLDFRILKEVGKVAVLAGFSEIIVTGGLGLLIAFSLGFASPSAVYIAIALAFSSTVLVVKILSDKKELDTLHGKIALGILIVEDIVAAFAIMIIPVINSTAFLPVFASIIKIIILISLIFSASYLFFNRLMAYLARSQEVLFLFGIAWALALAVLFNYLGFSLEIGALIAGMSLASTHYTLELSGKIKPIRDFFMVLFFVFFGSQLSSSISLPLLGKAGIFSLFVLVGKPIIVMSILRIFGYKKRTNFLAGASLAQISEFSLIIMLLGFNLGHISQELMSLAVLVSLITIGISSYGIYYSHRIFNKLQYLLNIFDGKKEIKNISKYANFDVVLFGYHRMGKSILRALKEKNVSCIVADCNPRVILSLAKKNIPCIYGDATDAEFLSELRLGKAKLIISTIPDQEVNLSIISMLKEISSKAVFIATSEQINNAVELYSAGADYVIVPHLLGGDYIAHLIKDNPIDSVSYRNLGAKHLKKLRAIKII